ncbi:hypothetical protein N0V83_010634 [Neocucurbitaria cava]|uniref:Uncharacterized protein n=1 Tax=Neocucurbitaria cava TaxID=798079 RepID=A0A9W8XZT2_9PLEO|nr:hypothetical protein N0V83_010634 [Neocucurbitaria cava]
MRKHKGRVSSNAEFLTVWNTETGGSRQMHDQTGTAAPVKLTDFVMYQPLDELGVNFFMTNYVGDDPTVSQLYYLPSFFARTGHASPGLQRSITAAGLLGYAKTSRRKDMIDNATRSYISAIRGINTALSDPTTAALEATLMSILMAAMFEVLIIPRLSGMPNCSRHLEGAVTVAFLLLKDGRHNDTTRKVLTTLVQSVIINSWIQHEPLPPGFTELKKQINELFDTQSAHGAFLDIIMELVLFRHALQDGSYESPMAIIQKALEIDITLDEYGRNMPQNARFTRFRMSGSDVEELAYEGYYHVYPQRLTAHLWNNVRSSRLRLHQVILRQSHILESSTLPDESGVLRTQQSDSGALIYALAVEISATVPQLAGYIDQLDVYRTNSERYAQAPPTDLPPSLIPPRHRDSTRIAEPTAPPPPSNPAPHPTHLYAPSQNPTNPPSPPSSTAAPPPVPAPPTHSPHPHRPTPSASLYHMLFQLYALRSIPQLPGPLKTWIRARIASMERNADAQDIARLQESLRRKRRPGDGFCVGDGSGAGAGGGGDEEGYVYFKWAVNAGLSVVDLGLWFG